MVGTSPAADHTALCELLRWLQRAPANWKRVLHGWRDALCSMRESAGVTAAELNRRAGVSNGCWIIESGSLRISLERTIRCVQTYARIAAKQALGGA